VVVDYSAGVSRFARLPAWQVLVCDVFDHDTFTSDDSLGSFVVLPEWYIPDTYDERPMAPPLGRVGFGLTRRTDWWPLFPVGKHKATGQLQLVVTNMALPTEDTTQVHGNQRPANLLPCIASPHARMLACRQDESKDDAMSTMSDMVVNGTSSQAVRDKMTQFRREQEAAVRLQCAWRRHVARRRVAEVRAQKAAELEEFQQQTAAALSIQAANRGRLGRAQVRKLRQEQKEAAEHKAREMVAIKLQAAWRGRQSRLRVCVPRVCSGGGLYAHRRAFVQVARLRAELEEKRRETDAALTIQAAFVCLPCALLLLRTRYSHALCCAAGLRGWGASCLPGTVANEPTVASRSAGLPWRNPTAGQKQKPTPWTQCGACVHADSHRQTKWRSCWPRMPHSPKQKHRR